MPTPNSFSPAQLSVIGQLTSAFDIDAHRIRFLNKDRPDQPWFPADVLMSIARQTGKFQSITERHDQFIPPLNQVIHQATVIDDQERRFTRSGAATVGEKLPNGEEIDAHILAGGRALSATLTAAGFNPLRAASVLTRPAHQQDRETDPSHTTYRTYGTDKTYTTHPPHQPQPTGSADEYQSRITDLKRIHGIAVRKGLIRVVGGIRDLTHYRRRLAAWYNGATSAASFDSWQRASLIQALELLPDADEFTV